MGKDLKGKDLGKGISQRKDGRYFARAMVNGKTIAIYNKSLTQLRKDFEFEKKKLLENANPKRIGITVEHWYDEWFRTYKSPQLKTDISRNTYNRKAKNTIIRLLGDLKVSDLKHSDIQLAVNELIDLYSERTIKEAIGVLRECLDIAILNRIIDINPCQSIYVKSNKTQEERRVLTHKEQDVFLEEVEGRYYKELYHIALLTGMRIGEISALTWDDINFEEEYIHVNKSMSTGYFDGNKVEEIVPPKTANSNRRIPFFGDVKQQLISWKKKQDLIKKKLGNRWRANPEFGDLVFTSTTGSPVTRYVLTHDINTVVKNINEKQVIYALANKTEPMIFKGLSPHTFRHTFCTRCHEKHLDTLFIQKIMGHSNYSTTVLYTHILDEYSRKEIDKAKNLLN